MQEINMTKEQIVKKWIDSMVKHGFMSGWMGDKSDEFKKKQYKAMMKVLDGDVEIIGGNYRLLATIHSDYDNLKRYCDWSPSELKELLALFGFTDIKHVVAVMGAKDRDKYMKKSKLKKEVEFVLEPIIFGGN
jgi:hypothetical protein